MRRSLLYSLLVWFVICVELQNQKKRVLAESNSDSKSNQERQVC